MTSLINNAFLKLSRRAETTDRAKLVETFVDVEPLFTLLSNRDHQVMYGRRGTGKTHALSYLAEINRKNGDAVIYLDLRTIGSTGGLYADNSLSISERATRLLLDTLGAMHNELLEYFLERAEELDLSRSGLLLDRLATAITEVTVVGNIESERKVIDSSGASRLSNNELSLSTEGPKLSLRASSDAKQEQQIEERITRSGVVSHHLHFGAVGQTLSEIARALGSKRIWVLLDEWSSLPLELQPYLADLLRRSAFPVTNLTVKIAAIEQRSCFRVATGHGNYIGLELGADIAADFNLDDFMVFDNDAERAKRFFKELLFKHFRATADLNTTQGPRTSSELVQQGFTQRNAFDEFVRATEGVPRDAINVINLAAQKALDDPISVNHIRIAARNWYQRDKEAAVKANGDAHALLLWIIDKVIQSRSARAFLFQADATHELMDVLFDARILHILKRNISTNDQPGVRYDAYKLDYGCYVDLINTARAPQYMLPDITSPDDRMAEVPQDDYRAIRRAILDINDFTRKDIDKHHEQLPT